MVPLVPVVFILSRGGVVFISDQSNASMVSLPGATVSECCEGKRVLTGTEWVLRPPSRQLLKEQTMKYSSTGLGESTTTRR